MLQILTRNLLVCGISLLMGLSVFAQSNPYQAFFEEAYQTYPSIPKGLLEAVAYTNTRMQHASPRPSCQGLPVYHGVMGLVEDGKDYFEDNLLTVAALSGFSIEEIKSDPRKNILAYAAAYAKLQQNKRMANQRVETHKPILAELSELPAESEATLAYAKDQQFYGVLVEMQNPHVKQAVRSRRLFDFESIFGAENYRVLSANRVTVEGTKVRSINGAQFDPNQRTTCTASKQQPDYAGALFSSAHSRNYGSRNGADIKYVTIHTIQGSYASAIAWFKNRNARVSAHYIIRASDGQVTQMVCETDKGYHVKTDNAESIGIEHEGFIDDGAAWYTNEMYESSAALVRDICSRHNIDTRKAFAGPPTEGIRTLTNTCYHIKGHQHFRGNNHVDPGKYWDWERFYRLINDEPTPEVLTDAAGILLDEGGATGNYGDLSRRTYLIQPEGATEVTLTFQAFELEGTAQEPFDYIDIYDGANSAGRKIGRFTGSSLPQPITARSGAIFMEFRSDCQVNKAGWKMRYTSNADNQACPAPKGLVASNVFPMGATLSWEATSGAQTYAVFIKRRNLEQGWTRYVTASNSLTITGLSSNALYTWQVQAVCGSDSSARVGATFVTPNTLRTGRAQVYTVRTNTGNFYDSGGKLSGYGNQENYLYRIIPPDGGKVRLSFSSFETEETLDQLTIYDGVNINNAEVLGTFSGKARPGTFTSTGNGLSILFNSDNRTNAKGWEATWRSIDGGVTPPPDPTDPTPDPDPPTDPDPTPDPTPVVFDPNLSYPKTAPKTTPLLKSQYADAFTVRFEDEDNSGRGLANRFYNVVAQTAGGWRAHAPAGFFFDDFSSGLRSLWTSQTGNWKVIDGLLTQTNTSLGNTNLHTPLTQTGDAVYLYHWQARMTGESDNRRHGIHFFCSDPAKPDRGTSYFVWIRDSDDGAFLEIYKTVNDQFDRKLRRSISLKSGLVYDYKTIYNPSKGRIEVYVNNEFSGSWVDPFPLTSGKALSLRSGNCVITYDNIQVFHARKGSVNIAPGESSTSPLQGTGAFRVYSLAVDRNIDWSPVGMASSRIGAGTPAPDDPVDPTPTPQPQPTDPAEPDVGQLAKRYTGDFQVDFGKESKSTYYLPSDYNGSQWTANRNLGFLHEDFSGTKLDGAWQRPSGKWRVENETAIQDDVDNSNTNLYVRLKQQATPVYLYQFRAKMLSEGDNQRFGLHFFASSGRQTNRGNSYLIWFRFNEAEADRVEIYKAEDNQLPRFRESAVYDLDRNAWYDIRVTYDPGTGQITVFVNGESAVSWQDDAPLRAGSYVSLRTGNAQVAFDDFRVHQRVKSNPVTITTGSDSMLRYRNKARLYTLTQTANGWRTPGMQETRIE